MTPFAILVFLLPPPRPLVWTQPATELLESAPSDEALDPDSPDADPDWVPPVLHTAAVFTVTRAVEAIIWPDPFADFDTARLGARYAETFTKPPKFDPDRPAFQWDGDPWAVNVVGHALMGSELYVRARACRFGPWGSLAFTAGASVVWEYAFEGNGVRPSALDLVYTPLAGILLGEARYFLWQRAAGIDRPGLRAAARAFVDPFGELERASRIFRC